MAHKNTTSAQDRDISYARNFVSVEEAMESIAKLIDIIGDLDAQVESLKSDLEIAKENKE